jgi:hypothetical protein
MNLILTPQVHETQSHFILFLMNGSLEKVFCTLYKICVSLTRTWHQIDKMNDISKESTVHGHQDHRGICNERVY